MPLQQPELAVPLATGIVLVALVANLASLALLYWLSGRVDRSGERGGNRRVGAPAGAEGRPSSGTVECTECGTENKRPYRYCRECVAQLPGAATTERSRSPPFGRFIG